MSLKLKRLTLVQEVVKELRMNHKTAQDVHWVGLKERWITWQAFARLGAYVPEKLDSLGNLLPGSREAHAALVIVGDGWFLERQWDVPDFSDGGYLWQFRRIPRKPDQHGGIRKRNLTMLSEI